MGGRSYRRISGSILDEHACNAIRSPSGTQGNWGIVVAGVWGGELQASTATVGAAECIHAPVGTSVRKLNLPAGDTDCSVIAIAPMTCNHARGDGGCAGGGGVQCPFGCAVVIFCTRMLPTPRSETKTIGRDCCRYRTVSWRILPDGLTLCLAFIARFY